ncbi:MAG: ABC transporter permease [Clostridia bacterium]|nr:ABC transporter permease [Clostridia bacterium]
MKSILTVFGYTFKIAARKRGFIITTAVILIGILLLCMVPRMLLGFTDGDPDSIVNGVFYTCYYVDDENLVPYEDVRAELQKALPSTKLLRGNGAEMDQYRKQINDDASFSVIVVERGSDGDPEVTVIARDFMSNMSTSAEIATDAVSRVYVAKTLADKGVSAEDIEFSQSTLKYTLAPERNISLAGYTMGILLITLVFFAVYYYGYGVASSIAVEKSSRVMETLVVSTKPANILIGKCLGMGTLGLCQFGAILAVAILGIKLLIPADFTFMGESFTFEVFTPEVALLTVAFFILGYALYAVMNAVCGATVSRVEDLNTAMMPVMIISMLSFYFSYFTAMMGSNYEFLFKIALYVPFTAPFVMPFALLNGMASPTDLLISAAILTICIAAVTALSVRIYTASVLHYGKRLKLRDAYKTKL